MSAFSVFVLEPDRLQTAPKPPPGGDLIHGDALPTRPYAHPEQIKGERFPE